VKPDIVRTLTTTFEGHAQQTDSGVGAGSQHEAVQSTPNLFAEFNGMPKGADKGEFHQHDQNGSNRMILGDSLQV